MESKRIKIDVFRQQLQERNADSEYTNQFLYLTLASNAKWLIKREVSAGRIYRNNSLFTPFVVDVIEVPLVDVCFNLPTNCKIYRSKEKLPETWTDNDGPIIKSVTSIDSSTPFFIIDEKTWQSRVNDPYQRNSKLQYAFVSNGYVWIPKNNPHKIIIRAFYKDDLRLLTRECEECQNEQDCLRFLDTDFMIPDWIEAEMYAKSLEQIAGITKRLPDDAQIDKNPNRKN